MGKFRGVYEPPPSSGALKEVPSQSNSGDGKDAGKKDGILSAKEVGQVKKSMQALQVGVALGNRYANAQPKFSVGRGAIDAIQSALPLKENLAAELEGTKVPELQETLGFLKQSIAVDKQTTGIGAGLKRRIASILKRLGDEGKQQASLIKKLEQALEKSEKKKAEAKKKKEEEARKKAEETRKESKEAKTKSE